MLRGGAAILAVCIGLGGMSAAQADDKCSLLTRAEAAAALGAPVEPGQLAISGCQWPRTGGQGFVQIEIAPARYYEKRRERVMLSGIGEEAFSYAEMGDPHAMARTPKSVVAVWTSGNSAQPAKVVELLKLVVSRVE
jgi:hypothetical protein